MRVPRKNLDKFVGIKQFGEAAMNKFEMMVPKYNARKLKPNEKELEFTGLDGLTLLIWASVILMVGWLILSPCTEFLEFVKDAVFW